MSNVYAGNEIVRIASEWLDANKSRAYPFDESCADSPNRIPSEVFTDAFFSVNGIGSESLYVSKVVLGQTSFQVYIRTESVDIGLLADIPYDTPERTQLSVDYDAGDNVSISGLLVVGDVTAIKSMMPVTDMTISDGKFFNGCVRSFVTEGVSGIKVGDNIYRGVVNLVPGPGVSFDVDQTPEETKITIRALGRQIPEDNLIIVSDKTLLEEISNIYGSPVTSINGVSPDYRGNIILAYPNGSSQGGGFSPFPAEVGSIVLQDSSGAVASCESTLVDTIMSNISELNERAARQAETTTAIDTANNVMSVSLSRMS